MRKGAIPVPHIIALILGIIVVGLLAFWFFVLGGKLPWETELARCDRSIHEYCTAWSACGYGSGCDPLVTSTWAEYSPSCNSVNKPKPTPYYCRLNVFSLLPDGSPCATAIQCAGGFCTDGVCASS